MIATGAFKETVDSIAGHPSRDTPFAAARALLVFFHGGGFVNCDIDTHDGLCRELAAASGCKVASVGYRLAPEYPFPAAADDALAATQWLIDHAGDIDVDACRIAVGGDSAGGNLAAGVVRSVKGPVGQLLLYPLLDFTYAAPSHVRNGQGFMLTAESLAWFRGHYLARTADWTDPRASPGLAAVHGELPPAYILVAGLDPLRDEALDYARRLRAVAVPVVERYATGQIHGFAMMTRTMTEARAAIGDAAAWLRERLAPGAHQ